MNGNPAAGYLGGDVYQQYGGAGGGQGGGGTILPTFACPTVLPPVCGGPQGGAAGVLPTLFGCQTLLPPHCYPPQGGQGGGTSFPTLQHGCLPTSGPMCPVVVTHVPWICGHLPFPPCHQHGWTAGCTFVAGPKVPTDPYTPVMGGAGVGPVRQFAAMQQTGPAAGQAQCGEVLRTLACTLGGGGAQGGQSGVDCKHVVWSMGCTFAGGEQRAGRSGECLDILGTTICTIPVPGGQQADGPMCITVFTATPTWCRPEQGRVDDGCKNIMWTAGCTFAGQGDQSQASRGDCGNVLTTLACTLGAEARDAVGDGCKDVLWTAGCTFGAGPDERCGDVLTTLACTLVAMPAEGAEARGAEDCKHVLWTAGCTFAAQPQASTRDDDCKVVMWTAGCTFPN